MFQLSSIQLVFILCAIIFTGRCGGVRGTASASGSFDAQGLIGPRRSHYAKGGASPDQLDNLIATAIGATDDQLRPSKLSITMLGLPADAGSQSEPIMHHSDQKSFLSLSQLVSRQEVWSHGAMVIKSAFHLSDAMIGIIALSFAIVMLITCICCCKPAKYVWLVESDDGGDSSPRSASIVSAWSEKQPMIAIAIVAALPALIDGVHFSIASGVLLRLDPDERLHLAMRAFIVGAFQLGQLVSTSIGSFILDGIGRKRSLQLFALGQLIALCVMAAWSESVWVLIGARFMTGIFFGQTVAPVYIAEMAPYKTRGSLVAWVEILTNFGGLVAMVVHLVMIDYPLWYQYVFYAIFSLVTCIAVSCLPHESMRDDNHQPAARPPDDHSADQLCPPTKGARLGLYIACLLAFLQQCSGDEALFGYCNQIAVRAGLSRPMLFSLTLASIFFLNNLIASGVVDSVGRRVIIIGGMLCMSASWASAGSALILGGGALVVLAFVLLYGFFSSLSLGPAYFVVASEVLPDEYRARGLTTSLFISRLTACAAVLTFELKNMLITLAGTFFVYAVLMMLGAIYMYFRLPETGGRKFSAIQRDLNRYAGAED